MLYPEGTLEINGQIPVFPKHKVKLKRQNLNLGLKLSLDNSDKEPVNAHKIVWTKGLSMGRV